MGDFQDLTRRQKCVAKKEKSIMHLEPEQLFKFESRYSHIIALGYEENPFPGLGTGTQSQEAGTTEKKPNPPTCVPAICWGIAWSHTR